MNKLLKYSLMLAVAVALFVVVGWAQDGNELPVEQELSLMKVASKGGLLMLPLLLLSLVAVYIFFERLLTINKATKVDPRFMDNIKECIRDGRFDAAKALCQRESAPIARMVEKGISHLGRPLSDIREAVENVGGLEVARLERGVPMLATTAGGAPMLGFLGTVIGMVQAFYNMSQAGSNIDISLLSGGIYTAMVTTIAGLTVGILAYFEYNYLSTRIKNFVNKMEANTIYFMDILNEPSK